MSGDVMTDYSGFARTSGALLVAVGVAVTVACGGEDLERTPEMAFCERIYGIDEHGSNPMTDGLAAIADHLEAGGTPSTRVQAKAQTAADQLADAAVMPGAVDARGALRFVRSPLTMIAGGDPVSREVAMEAVEAARGLHVWCERAAVDWAGTVLEK
ncbi:hypothetical protein [Hoyosella altamirensis]|uniref:Uncharacterized protein n=1 Tax=Hoyosella altamirensis TaxID=616997 RepID=A0A839RIK2_9ACTN|nr:hypothetical protein [Hoyosella altamirensis]MBB3035976.1 hypothetical protein [Hoyosella altamirensis]